jgi:hypothetical protein
MKEDAGMFHPEKANGVKGKISGATQVCLPLPFSFFDRLASPYPFRWCRNALPPAASLHGFADLDEIHAAPVIPIE